MPNTFYYDACNVDSRATPFPINNLDNLRPDADNGLNFYQASNPEEDGRLMLPHSIMNEHVAINYRTIYNGYALYSKEANFTEYSDFQRCQMKDRFMMAYLQDKRNPTYKNIIQYYSNEDFDPWGLARYKMQDFIYLKYYNQIPNNYMITLRRYTRPCSDHMFGLDMPAEMVNRMNGYGDDYFNLATAVTYMGEQTGNKLSDILKFDYGANWEEKEGKTESLQNPDGGLAAQMKDRFGVAGNLLAGEGLGTGSKTAAMKGLFMSSMLMAGKGITNYSDAIAKQHQYETNTFNARYGEELYGDVNVINKVQMRSRGLTFSNSFTLTFEYSLKSLKCVNPRIAMMDILSNFLVLTGNYGTFWGGETIFYGNRSIAPQYGDPDLLRQGKYGAYLKSLVGDIKEGFQKITGMDNIDSFGQGLTALWNGIKTVGGSFLQGLVGNLLGGNIGIAGEGVAVPALLSGNPSGFWHVTVGNPLDPIAMMGNMAIKKTTVQFGDALGYDDFPTEIKFTVDLEHCMPRDNSQIENMFNGTKGRFYSFTNGDILNAYRTIDSMQNFQGDENIKSTEVNTQFEPGGSYSHNQSTHNNDVHMNRFVKTIGGFLNG